MAVIDWSLVEKKRQQRTDNKYGETQLFRHYRNVVNCKRKVLRSNYYASKSNHLKQIASIALAPGSDSLFANLQIEGSTILPEH